MIIPQRHNKHHSALESFTHFLHSPLLTKSINITISFLLGLASLICQRVERFNSWNIGHSMLDNLTILNKQTFDFYKITTVSTIAGNELGNNSHWLGRIYSKVTARTKECFVSSSVSIQITSIFITKSFISGGSIISTIITFTWCISINRTNVRSICGVLLVRLPNIHFIAADSKMTFS